MEPGQTWSWSLDGETWAQGQAPLGYGGSQVRTPIVGDNEKPLCAFFRKTFRIDDHGSVARLFFDIMVDDGAIITLNGNEVIRHNMPRGDITNESLAIHTISHWREKEYLPLPVDLRWLQAGTNTIEARVHQRGPGSSDLVFDLAVRAKKKVPPRGDVTNAGYACGMIADCQYCNVEASGRRLYALSKTKLSECVAELNKLDLAYVMHLGDFIDRDFESFDVVNPIFNRLRATKYHVLGNHDFSVADHLKKEVPGKMGMPARYYDFEVEGWRHVVLDGNDISFHAYPENSENAKAAAEYYEANQIESPRWNGAIGPGQLAWLREVLERAQANREKVILFCHFPVYPPNKHNLWNAEELIAVLESYPCVKAYINGHNHNGNYGAKEGIHYLTLKGMVDTTTNSYAVVTVDDDSIDITGYGREEDRSLPLHHATTPDQPGLDVLNVPDRFIRQAAHRVNRRNRPDRLLGVEMTR